MIADRVVMPHPSGAMEFLPKVLGACRDGATIHLYAFVENDGGEKEFVGNIRTICGNAGFACRIKSIRQALSYSPHAHQACADFTIRRARK